MSRQITVIDRSGPMDTDAVRTVLRDLVETSRDGVGRRCWAVLGELAGPGGEPDDGDAVRAAENARAVEHDRVGRFLVRLAVDYVVSVGTTRVVRALHQGAVMEGSWGDEARLVDDPAAAVQMLLEDLADGDVVLLAGGGGTGRDDLSLVAQSLLDSDRYTVTFGATSG
ncbi:glutamate ligase domain-containing protein [Williamsia sp. CHRR-6]|uniref:glutamate ligase domain-containing protein n=1 Tax=Williamsia sp. CHRR-6 TaxID=2835871 RepID=UPI001BDAF9AE|nr:UDP-N-acetylmuramoyl-tripeptide--D-alanyl-D-alanine ligase [Williamsia sp. CHRR-6]MBT0565265.1 UDP-N-acetylmuramoyl-tripeptide--D-alanyl-D-alanine ligase [Williamsia sp. CHRR-6]